MSFADEDIHDGDAQYLGMYTGVVVDRDDPDLLGRVRFRISGLIEPESPWALPLLGGSYQQGIFFVPPLEAEVAIWFHRGNIERPYYLPANWGITRDDGNETPNETKLLPPDNRVISTPDFTIQFDGTANARRLRIENRQNGDSITLDAQQNSIFISASTALVLYADGIVDIRGAAVQIQGRPVRTSGDPI